MNKKTFEDWLNKQNFISALGFFADNKESKTLTDTLITEHGQEYFDATISNYINEKLEEMILNPKNKEGISPRGFYPLECCFSINDEISSNIAGRFYELCIKHCAKDFEIRSGKLLEREMNKNLPSSEIPDFTFPYVFSIINHNRQYFNEQQIQALFDSVVDVIDKRGTLDACSKLNGVKLNELRWLTSIVCNNLFLNTENLQRVVLEKPRMKCYKEKENSHNSAYEAALLYFAQTVKADANLYVEKLLMEKKEIEYIALEFLGFGRLAPSTQNTWSARSFKGLKPIENLNPEFKEYCRDQLLLQRPKLYEKLVELEQATNLVESEQKQQNNKQSKFYKIKSFFKHEFEKSL